MKPNDVKIKFYLFYFINYLYYNMNKNKKIITRKKIAWTRIMKTILFITKWKCI